MQQNLSIRLTGGYALSVGTLWLYGTGRNIKPTVDVESGIDIRICRRILQKLPDGAHHSRRNDLALTLLGSR